MKCYAHIINLIACVCNVVRYVRSSSKSLLTKFKTCVELEKIDCKALVCLDVPTRRNSTYLMRDHALIFEKAFQILEEEELDYQDYFSMNMGRRGMGHQVILIGKMLKILSCLLKCYIMSLYNKISGSLYVTVNSIFHEMWRINDLLIGWSNEHNSILRNMVINMKSKHNKYWGSVKKINKLVFLVVMLNPRYKLDYVGFCFESINDDVMVKVLVDEIEAYLM